METQPFDKNHYKIKRVQDGTDDNGNDRFLYFMQTVDGNDCYGTDGWLPHIEIMKVEIDYKEKTIVLPQNIIKKYFDPHGISVYIGLDNELYIRISGGDGVAWYAAWFSVVKGKVVFESVEELCI
jgi:hypothetical protein